MFPNIIRMIILKNKNIPEYAINVNSIISIGLRIENNTGKIQICTVDKTVFKIIRKPNIIYDLYMKIISFCTYSNSDTVIPDNNILEIESD